MNIAEHFSALIAVVVLVILFGIAGELEIRDIKYIEHNQQEQRR